MKPNKDFDASEFINTIDKDYILIDKYFTKPQLDIMDSIDELYNLLDLENEIIPLTTIEMLNKEN